MVEGCRYPGHGAVYGIGVMSSREVGWMDRRQVARLIFWLALGFAAGVAAALFISLL